MAHRSLISTLTTHPSPSQSPTTDSLSSTTKKLKAPLSKDLSSFCVTRSSPSPPLQVLLNPLILFLVLESYLRHDVNA